MLFFVVVLESRKLQDRVLMRCVEVFYLSSVSEASFTHCPVIGVLVFTRTIAAMIWIKVQRTNKQTHKLRGF
jgi:hypothetical protein